MITYRCNCEDCSGSFDTEHHQLVPGVWAAFCPECTIWIVEEESTVDQAESLMPAPEKEVAALREILAAVLSVHQEFCKPTVLTKMANKVIRQQVTAVLGLGYLEQQGIIA